LNIPLLSVTRAIPIPISESVLGSGTAAVAENEPLTLLRGRNVSGLHVPPGQKRAVICAGVILGMVALNPPVHSEPDASPPRPVSLARPNNPMDKLVPNVPIGVSTSGDPAIEHVTIALVRQLVAEPAAMPCNSKTKSGCAAN